MAYEYVGEAVVDALPMEPPVQMQITGLGVDGQIARVELLTGSWPVTGTIVSLAQNSTPTVSAPTTCPFAVLVLDELTAEGIRGATVSVIVGTQQDTGVTDSDGSYRSRVPCQDGNQLEARVRVTASGYQLHTKTIALIDETQEILLSPTSIPPNTELVVKVLHCNVRSGSGIDQSIIGAVSTEEKLVAIGRNSDGTWWQIKYQERTGWISDVCVSQNDFPTPLPNIVSPTATPVPSTEPIFEQQVGNVTYTLLEVEDRGDSIVTWISAINQASSLDTTLCVTQRGYIPSCRLIDEAGNPYKPTGFITGNKAVNGASRKVTLPKDTPFRFGIRFPVSDIGSISLLETPIIGSVVRFHSIPLPYHGSN